MLKQNIALQGACLFALLLLPVASFDNATLLSNTTCSCMSQTADEQAQLSESSQVAHIMSILLNKQRYNKADIPSSPTVVQMGIYVNNFDSISEQSMDYSINIYLRQQWIDPRLAFGHLANNVQVIKANDGTWDHIWIPDPFFRNEKNAKFHSITTPNRLIWIYRDGTVYYSSKITSCLSCPMDLRTYPLDRQICSIEIESYGHTSDQVKFEWRPNAAVEHKDETKLNLMEFRLEGFNLYDCSANYSSGHFPCLQVDFYLKRDIGFFVIQLYLPTALVVILSWVSFWISDDAVPARVTIGLYGLLTVLTMTTQNSGARSQLPRVSYVKAIDVWLCTCLLFVFASLLEYAAVNYYSRKRLEKGSHEKAISKVMETFHESDNKVLRDNQTSAAMFDRNVFKLGEMGFANGRIKHVDKSSSTSTNHEIGQATAALLSRLSYDGENKTYASNLPTANLATGWHMLRTPPEATKLRCVLGGDILSEVTDGQPVGGSEAPEMLPSSGRYDLASCWSKPASSVQALPSNLQPVPINAIDSVARAAFPLCFFLFNLMYWPYYFGIIGHSNISAAQL